MSVTGYNQKRTACLIIKVASCKGKKCPLSQGLLPEKCNAMSLPKMVTSPAPCPRPSSFSTQHHIYIYTGTYQYIFFSIFRPPQWFSTRRRPVLRHSGRSHLCLWQQSVPLHWTLWRRKKKDSKQWTKRHDLQGEWGLWTQRRSPRKWTRYGQRGILYMLSYKWCFVRRLLTKTTVPFWCETGSDQNTAKPVGQWDEIIGHHRDSQQWIHMSKYVVVVVFLRNRRS